MQHGKFRSYFRGCSSQVCPREYSLGLSYDSGIFMGVGRSGGVGFDCEVQEPIKT